MDTRKKIETAHQTAMRANTRNGVSGSSGLYVPELLSPEDTKAIQTYEEDNATTTAKLNAQLNVNLTNGNDDADDPASAPPAAPVAPASAPPVAPASAPPAAPVSVPAAPDPAAAALDIKPPRVEIKEFGLDDNIEARALNKNPGKSSIRPSNSPKKRGSVRFGGGRRRS
jgi:hypothetical protein